MTINLAQGQHLGCLALSGAGLGCHEQERREVLLEPRARRPEMLLRIPSAQDSCDKELSGPKWQVFCVCFFGAVLGLCCCEGISLLVSRGCSLVPGLGLLIAAALEEHSSGLSGFSRCSFWALERGAQVLLFHGMWDLPQSGINLSLRISKQILHH
ncbi:unnamed protein product [Rangifer tarandus platyrhynchus]|uniref:Uncharacterized protein n=2 Tax=Rangifer tarandus platyrhynchus TaxID=3082113 RepID=A0AC59ZPY2_RANTA|nr:unnamed protein product [Rangifer tarandus platyrhynchus]